MGLDLDYIDGQTPLDDDEKEGLIIATISTRAELDEFEQQNIEQAIQWTLMRNFKNQDILTEKFVIETHKRMYGNVWKWAGEFRKTNKNIGVDKWQISVELKNLLDDVKYWIDHKIYPAAEIAIRFKHRIVSIHCFPNGNGRHSRLMADIIIEKVFKQTIFSWGATNLAVSGKSREIYLKAVKEADKGSYSDLLKFARS
jgi:Fic-DOC domain mobile mystery protein B